VLVDCFVAAHEFASQSKQKSTAGLCKDGIHGVDWFFDMNPGEVGFSHLPTDPEWQLSPDRSLGSSVLLTDASFRDRPMVKHNFFKLSLTLLSHPSSGVLWLAGNTATLSFGVPKGIFLRGVLRGSSRACLMVREGAAIHVHFRAPPGESDLTIYAVSIDGEGVDQCEPVEVVKYRVHAMNRTAAAVPGPCVQDFFMPYTYPSFFRCNLGFPKTEADSMPPSTVTIPKGSNSVEILLRMPKDIEIQVGLQESEMLGVTPSDAEHLTFVQRELHPHGAGLVHIRVGRPGPNSEERWLHVLARRHGGVEFSRAITLMVDVQHDSSKVAACDLPSMFGPFSGLGCFVHEPVLGILQAGAEQKFSLTMPREVLRVAVVIQGTLEEGEEAWYNLKVKPLKCGQVDTGGPRTFQASIYLPKGATAAAVLAQPNRTTGSFISLLKYSVIHARTSHKCKREALAMNDDKQQKLVSNLV
jgi:hypothetical protein